MSDLKNEIHDYWTNRARGYSEYNQQEMADARQTMWRAKLLDLLGKQFPEREPKEIKILDVGTGPGFFAVLMGRMGWQVTGIDCSEKMVETAARNAGKAGVHAEFYQMDNHQLDFPEDTFDYIICRNVTWILYDPEKAFAEWKRVLKPGGRILYFDANWHMTGNAEYREDIKRDEEEYRKLYGDPENTYTGDENTDQEFQKVLYFNEILRPNWDEIHLPTLGYENMEIVPRVNEQVYSEKKQLLYRSIPMFLVCADKPAERMQA